MRRALILGLGCLHCYATPETHGETDGTSEADPTCATEGCGESSSSGMPDPEASTSGPPPGPSTASITVGHDESTSAAADEDTTSSFESTSTGDSSDDTQTGEPEPAGLFEACAEDLDCMSGVCSHGFCTEFCWTQVGGSVPCPAAPGGVSGITIVCDTLPYPQGGGLCEGCFDCAAYCIPVCTGASICAEGTTCVDNECGPDSIPSYCG